MKKFIFNKLKNYLLNIVCKMKPENFETGFCTSCGIIVEYPIKYSGMIVPCSECGGKIVIGIKQQRVTYDDVSHNVGPKKPIVKPFCQISNINFRSTKHKRYNQGQWNGLIHDANRLITIRPDKEYNDSYIVTIYQPGNIHPVFHDDLNMSPKRMEVILSLPNEGLIVLQGYGSDPLLSSRPPQIQKHYAVILEFEKSDLNKISLLMLDRQALIVYYK